MLKEDSRLPIGHTVETTYIHATTAYRIVSDDLGMKKVSARWVPGVLTDEQKQNRVDSSLTIFVACKPSHKFFLTG